MRWTRLAIVVLLAAPSSTEAQGVRIEHQAVACVVADRFAVVAARVEPADKVARARVVFRATGTPIWYFVEMRREKQAFRGTLPKPLKATQKIEYYIDAVDRSMGEFRTAEYSPAVVGGAGECPSKMLTAAALASAKIAVGSLAPGIAALPAGFSSVGVIGGSVAGSGALTGAAVGGGGGLSTGAIVGIVAGAAAVGGGVLVASAAHSEPDRPETLPGSGWDITLTSTPPEPGNFSGGFSERVCNPDISPPGRNFGGGVLIADASGAFDVLLPLSQPIVRVSGRVTQTSLSTTLTCLVGGATAPMNATSSSGQFQGATPLNGRMISFTVSKKVGP